MSTVLLTCGRGTFSLTLARAFHAAGHRVLVADAWPRSLCRYSAAVSRYFYVPSPAKSTTAWAEAVHEIVKHERVDLIVPIYEEVLHLAKALTELAEPLPLFAADFQTLIALHDKWRFNQTAQALGLSVPDSVLLTSRKDVEREFPRGGRNRVFKPVYSRFAAQTVVRPASLESLELVEPTPQKPWLSQAFLPGRPYATFSIAHRGRMTAHVTYATDFCHDLGPTVVYRRADHPAIQAWVQKLIEGLQFTGQIGLDFIEDENGQIAGIECNPRLTGGFYLLKDNPRAAAAYFEPTMEPIEAARDRSYAFRYWLFFTLFRHTKSFPGFREWCRHLFFARSTNALSWSDPMPRLMGPILAGEFLLRCRREGKTVREMVTLDFEWSEEPTRIAGKLGSTEEQRHVA
jgi:predicted ATP-grasp superfamily ATP-dependent carboligase